MASKVSGVIEKINISGVEQAIASTAYGYCETAAATAAKTVEMTNFKLYEGVTIHVKFKERNTAANPTLNVESTGAKPIVIYGTTATPSNDDTNSWYAGAVLSLTYDGTSWVKSQAVNTNTWRGIVDNLTSSTATTTSLSGKQGYLLANGDARDNTKLPLSGGQMTGPLTWKDNTALPEATSGQYFLIIDAFASGGTTKWIGKANALTSLGAASSSHDHSGTYVPNTTGANDVNTLVNTGIYNITSGSATNTPKGYKYGQLLVMSYRKHTGNTTTDWASQIYLHNGGGTASGSATAPGNVLYYRTSNSSSSNTWFDWQKAVHAAAAYSKVGDTNKPVYIAEDGTATAISYTIEKSVPSNAVFTDHYAWGDITGKPTKITLTGAVTGNVSLGSGDLSLSTTVNHNHDDRYKIASGVITLGSSTITPVTNVNGHTGSSVSVTASDLGLASALKYVGTKSSLPTATDSTTYSTYNNGDVITVSNKEYAYVKGSNATGSSWVELGDEGSYKLKQTAFTNSTGTADGSNTSTTFIYSFSQDANGVITDIKTRKLPTYNNYSHPTGDGNLHVPATGTGNNGKFLKAGSTAGSLSWALLGENDIPDLTGYKTRKVQTGSLSAAGWYRILNCTAYPMSFFITFYGIYSNSPPTPVTFLVSHSYNSTSITQIGKCAYIGYITKIRAIHHDTSQFYIDIYYSGTKANQANFEITPLDPQARSSITLVNYTAITDTLTSNAECNTTLETTVDTFKEAHLINTEQMGFSAWKPTYLVNNTATRVPVKTMALYADGLAITSPATNNDAGWIRVTGSGEADTVFEIATSDDANNANAEKIVARQYTSSALVYEAMLLGKDDTIYGATRFPVQVKAPKFIGILEGHATSATYLGNIGRQTSMDVDFGTTEYNSKVFISYADANTTTNKPSSNSMIFNVAWDNVSGNHYGAQIALHNQGTPHLQIRGCTNGTWDTSWLTVLDSNNYNTYAAAKSHTHGDITNDGKLTNANRIVWTDSNKKIYAGYHYINSTKMAINSPNEPSYNLYVNGTSYINGATTINSTLTVNNNLTVKGTALQITNTSGAKYILIGNQDSSGANCPTILMAANGTLYIGNGTDWSSNTGGTINTALFMSADRKIGIGTTGPTAELDVNGDIFANKIKATALGANRGWIAYPDGGNYYTTTSTITGALKIGLPVQKDTMISFDVNIYTYQTNLTRTVYHISGYVYGSSGWYEPVMKVYTDGLGAFNNLTVRFGKDNNKPYVTIGETNTSWSYPQIAISNVHIGYNSDNNTFANWASGWTVNFITTLPSNSAGSRTEVKTQDINITGNAANITGTVAVAHGGTGATTAADAWTALGGGDSGKHADSYFALASHGTHVTTATVQSALSINTSSGSTSKALTEKGTFVTFGTSNLTIGTTSSTAMAGNTVVNKVNQTLKSDNTEYKFLGTASTATGNAEAVFDTDLTFNPNTNAITASIYRVTSAANISYNSTNGCLEIVV